MRAFIIGLFAICSISFEVVAQTGNKFEFTIDYSPNLSKIREPLIQSKAKLSHNAFVKIEYPISNTTKLTVGLGFMNSGERIIMEHDGQFGLDRSMSVSSFNYACIPVGFKINFKRFYVSPEAAIAIIISGRENFRLEFSDGTTRVTKRPIDLYGGKLNSPTIPLILNIGREFQLKNASFYSGIRMYYSLVETVSNTPGRDNQYYGLGIVAGIKL